MSLLRRHDRYVLRSFLAALGTSILFLSSLVIIYDLADRIDKLPKRVDGLKAQGLTPAWVIAEYYATLLPFLWIRILPVAGVIAAGATFTWLARQNELVPLVTSGIPTRRIVLPVLLAATVVAGLQTLVREVWVPRLSRRHHDLHRMLSDDRPERLKDVQHITDAGGGRLSMAAYLPRSRRIEGAWITFPRDPSEGGRTVVLRYPLLRWDEPTSRWIADRGGERRVLEPREAGAVAAVLGPADPVPLALEPSLLELSLREGAALGFSSAEIAKLARVNPEKVRFTLLLHQQWASPFVGVVLLLLSLPLGIHLGRRVPFLPSFAKTVAVVALFFTVDSLVTDMGARGALNPIVAAWTATVVFGALGLVLVGSMET